MKKIMVVGCGRSGTLYMSKVFGLMGLDVAHEKLGQDGISSWLHSFGARQKRLIQRDINPDPRYMLHLVRNPVGVINSMVRVSQSKARYALGYFKDLCPDGAGNSVGYELAMKYWTFWNRMTEIRGAGIDKRIRVEDLQKDEIFADLCSSIGVPFHPVVFQNLLDLGTKIHSSNERDICDITFEEMKEISPKEAKKVSLLAKEYGYEIDQ
jgi:hypothetical protein